MLNFYYELCTTLCTSRFLELHQSLFIPWTFYSNQFLDPLLALCTSFWLQSILDFSVTPLIYPWTLFLIGCSQDRYSSTGPIEMQNDPCSPLCGYHLPTYTYWLGANLLDKLRQLTTLNLGHSGMTPQSIPIISSEVTWGREKPLFTVSHGCLTIIETIMIP